MCVDGCQCGWVLRGVSVGVCLGISVWVCVEGCQCVCVLKGVNVGMC